MNITKHCMAAGAVVIIGSGCATVDPRARLPHVQKDLAGRDVPEIRWRADGPTDRQVDARLAAMLAEPLTADHAVQIALLNNRRLQMSFEELGIAQADLVQAGLLRNPVFDGSLRFGGGKPTVDLGIAFDFLDVVFIGLRKQVAESQRDAVEADVTASVLELAMQTRLAFLDVQYAQQLLELRQQSADAVRASTLFATKLREAGNITQLELDGERAFQEETTLSLADARADLIEKREALNLLLGTFGMQTGWSIQARLPDVPAENIAARDAEKRAVTSSLRLRRDRAEVALLAHELGMTKPLGWLSDLELGAIAERDDGWSAGPSVAFPLPVFSQGKPALARAQAAMRQKRDQLYADAVEVRSTARLLVEQTRSLHDRTTRLRQTLLPLRQQIVEQTQLHYNAMQLGLFALLQAKRDQIDAGHDYITLLRDYWSARTRLDSLLNGHLVDRVESIPNRTSSTMSRSAAEQGH